MAKKKSAQRRNKQFKAVDPFRRGKSTKGLGTGQGRFIKNDLEEQEFVFY